MKRILALVVPTLLTMMATEATAKNIDLSTIPPRDSVQLTIYNGADLTLVRETRKVSFKKGTNRLQFSWANTLIDPTSVQLKFLEKPHRLSLLDTTYPHNKPRMLYWNVKSDFAGEATLQISYFTSGISWRADYVGIADADEQQMRLNGYVTVDNNSGEDYADAHVRLVVGKINLVEKIKKLAEQGMGRPTPGLAGPNDRQMLRSRVMRKAVQEAEAQMGQQAAGPVQQRKEIVKEGLSEYFIFSIEGRETIPDTWSKRLQSFRANNVPIDVQYRYRKQQYGDQLVRMFLLENSQDADLGKAPLPNGNVRLFKRTSENGLTYLTRQSIDYIPIGEDIELNLGPDREVVFEQKPMRVFRDHIWADVQGIDVHQRIDQPNVRIERDMHVIGWNRHTVYRQRIRNYTDKPIDVQIRRRYSGDVIFKSRLDPTLHNYQTVQYETSVEPGRKKSLPYEVIHKTGENAEQDHVTLEAGEPATVPWLEKD